MGIRQASVAGGSLVVTAAVLLAACSGAPAVSPPAVTAPPIAVPTASSSPTATATAPSAAGGACPAEAGSLEPTILELTAEAFEFSTDELRTTACRPTVIEFSHTDTGSVHNVSLYTEALGNGDQLFRGQLARDGEMVRYEIPPLMPGMYQFICDPHWQSMGGAFVVEE